MESSPRGGPKSSYYKLLNWLETTVQKSMGINLTTAFPLYTCPNFVTSSSSAIMCNIIQAPDNEINTALVATILTFSGVQRMFKLC